MNKVNIVTVLGARPQFIKAAAMSRILKNQTHFKEIIVHTGQHFDPLMSDVFFEELQIPHPQFSLNIHGGQHGEMTGRMLAGIEEVLLKEKADAVMVYGDTNSTLAGALAAAKLNIPVFHIEAGLRSFNRRMPEEINRVMVDHLSAILFCPTPVSIENLKKEGIVEGVYHVGDIMYDAAVYAMDYVGRHPEIIDKFTFSKKPFALLTIHRAQSTESLSALRKILQFTEKFAQDQNIQVIFPVHPRTQSLMQQLDVVFKMISPISPISYFEMQALLAKASYVLTDSGGLQKEAYFHQVPCITLREETEWVETIQNGWNRLWRQEEYRLPRLAINDYGDGETAKKIINQIKEFF